MQLNAALRRSQVLRSLGAVSRRALSRSVGLASFGARRPRSVVSQSTAAVGVGRPSFGGQRTVCAGSRPSLLGASGASAHALSGTVAWAAIPAWSAHAPRSTVRCSSALALSARRGCGCSRSVSSPSASCKGACLRSRGASKLTVVNASHFIGCGSANAAPNPSVKRTA